MFIFSSRLEPMACLSIEQQWDGNTIEEARLSCCAIGMIPDGPLTEQEKAKLYEVYGDSDHLKVLLVKHFSVYNT